MCRLTTLRHARRGGRSHHGTPNQFRRRQRAVAGRYRSCARLRTIRRAKIDLRLQNLDVARMMAATHTFEGAGSVSGVGAIEATGILASLLVNGNGGMKMAMAGGDLSAVLVDLTGLQFGKALLSALGVPQKTPVQCFVGDLNLKRGTLDFTTMTLDTGEAIVNVGGQVNLVDEKIDLNLKTNSKKFSVGSLPTRLNITGTFKDPWIRARGRGRCPYRCGGRARRAVPAAGDPADGPVRHIRGRGCALRGAAETGAGPGCRQGSHGPRAKRQPRQHVVSRDPLRPPGPLHRRPERGLLTFVGTSPWVTGACRWRSMNCVSTRCCPASWPAG